MGTMTERQAQAIPPGGGTAIWFLANRVTIKAAAEDTGGGYSLCEVVVAPGFATPVHIHHREDEAFYVLDGRFRFECAGEAIDAGPGTYVSLPRDVPHWFANVGDVPGRMLNIMSPGGGEGFFLEGGRPAEADGLPPAGPPDAGALARASAMYGAEIVGPPPVAPTGAR
jgi:mannose-6-phosphate isomerase-like protein (cupin superfamily)